MPDTRIMRVSFFGACREVTGSNILVEARGKKILLDCGFFQGQKLSEERNYAPFPYQAAEIDLVIVGHAHLDHTGRLPKLVKDGFRGRIISTAPTSELTKLVLEDSAKLMREESEREGHAPLYGQTEIDEAMELFESLSLDETVEILPGVKLTFKNAGHILGSAVTVLAAEEKQLVYTSDLGNQPSELLAAPQTVDRADVVICESTYGGRTHENIARRHQKLNEILSATIKNKSVLMIPSFAIERTQELLHDIEHFCTSQNCAIPEFFLDSPLAAKVTGVFEKYPEFLNPKLNLSHEDVFGLSRLKITSTVEESMQIDETPGPKIIIAGSGMINGGRILRHLQNYIEDPKNTLLIVGYQAQGTLGRRLFDGEKRIKIFGKHYNVLAKVLAIGSYSAHADSVALLDWLEQIKEVKKIYLVHGESKEALAFEKSIRGKIEAEVVIPQRGEGYEL